jgi:hypothetical protein
VVPEGLDDKVDVYHAAEFTGVWPRWSGTMGVFFGG